MTADVSTHAGSASDAIEQTQQREQFESRMEQYNDRHAADRAMLALDAGRMGSWRYDILADTVTGDPFVAELLGLNYEQQPWKAEDVYASMHPDDLSRVQLEVNKALNSGDLYEVEFRNRRVDATTGEEGERWLGARGRVTRRANDGTAAELLGVNWDATERKKQEHRLRYLAGEMDHRIKNMFAIIEALISVGARTADSVPSFAGTLRTQIQAMATAHSATAELARETDSIQRVPVITVFDKALQPWRNAAATASDRLSITLDIPDSLSLDPSKLASLSMLVYELTTNATKYGPLGARTGRLDVSITTADNNVFTLHWRERMEPITEISGTPANDLKGWKKGFGTTLIEYCAKTLEGRLERTTHANGVDYTLTAIA